MKLLEYIEKNPIDSKVWNELAINALLNADFSLMKKDLKKAEELYELALEKGTPVLEKTASEVRQKTIDVLNNTIEKLEQSEKKSKKTKKTA